MRWHRAGFRSYWRWKSRNRGGRPRIDRHAGADRRDEPWNPLWGAPRIRGELLKLGFQVAQSTVGSIVRHRLRAMGIRDKPIAPWSPWQNGFAERLIGSIRRECLDHIIVFGEEQLRRVLQSYACYYNGTRTHRSLRQGRARPSSYSADWRLEITSHLRRGLHHQYIRISVFGTHRANRSSQ